MYVTLPEARDVMQSVLQEEAGKHLEFQTGIYGKIITLVVLNRKMYEHQRIQSIPVGSLCD